ncbi:MAG TPA: oligosaccharide flippase family protein [Bryobacterales bacterium]|nr:oligosaccharide flippase family protein [Bryobacterales bacterium]
MFLRASQSVRVNVVFNIAGRAWNAVLAVICIPWYINYMGVEAYGLVGFFSAVNLLLSTLDLGLGPTFNRELAVASAGRLAPAEVRNLARTLETIYWTVAVTIGVGWIYLSRWISHVWLRPQHLAPGEIQWAVTTMGLVLLCQWPFNLYLSGLMGMQRQALANVITSILATMRSGGAVIVLAAFSPTITAFFVWQAIVACLGTMIAAWTLWRYLPAGATPHFDVSTLRKVSRFSLGVLATGLASLLLQNADKIVLSRMLPLEGFGYYMLAITVASGLYVVVSAFYASAFPRFSQLYAACDLSGVSRLYHTLCQTLTVVVAPVALVIAMFPYEVVFLWTGKPATAANSALLVSLLVLGAVLNTSMYIPYALTLAYGWTSFGFYQSLIATIILVPLTIVAVVHSGAVGAAVIWLVLNVGYIFISAPVMHWRLLPGQLGAWYLEDLGRPLLASLMPVLLARMAISRGGSRSAIFCELGLLGAIALLCSLASAPLVRTRVKPVLSELRTGWSMVFSSRWAAGS